MSILEPLRDCAPRMHVEMEMSRYMVKLDASKRSTLMSDFHLTQLHQTSILNLYNPHKGIISCSNCHAIYTPQCPRYYVLSYQQIFNTCCKTSLTDYCGISEVNQIFAMPNIKATKVIQKRSDAAVESFHRYYAGLWGEERWTNSLYPALCKPTRYCALINSFGDSSLVSARILETGAERHNILLGFPEGIGDTTQANNRPYVLLRNDDSSFPAPEQISSRDAGKTLLSHWNLDYASVLAASLLQVKPEDKVLDLCAAPGGKSMVLAQMLWPTLYYSSTNSGMNASILHSNEMDSTRQKRLSANMQSYLPPQLFTNNAVDVLRVDGSSKNAVNELPLGAGGYDKVLVDAPCSSERHIIQAHIKATAAGQVSEEMSSWKSTHTRTLAKTQLALLVTALKAVNVGGSVLYATCSLSAEENDTVVERAVEALKKSRKDSAESSWKVRIINDYADDTIRAMLDASTEKTTYGRIALPDHPSGGKWGPLYFSLLQKVARKTRTPA